MGLRILGRQPLKFYFPDEKDVLVPNPPRLLDVVVYFVVVA